MQRFAGLNSIEGWNLTFQLSGNIKVQENLDVVWKNLEKFVIISMIICSYLL